MKLQQKCFNQIKTTEITQFISGLIKPST